MRIRCYLALLMAFALTVAAPAGTLPKQGPIDPALQPIDDAIEQFMVDNSITAGTFGLMRDGVVLAQRSYGWIDQTQTVFLPPDATMRIASCTKPITAAAIHRLVEDGLLDLDEFVFDLGQTQGGILDLDPSPQLNDNRLALITVRHLLQHRGGWDRDACIDENNGNLIACDDADAVALDDLTYEETEIATGMSVASPPSRADTVRWILGRATWINDAGIVYQPGSTRAYSNEGYLLLGMIIEARSGMDYIDYVEQRVFDPIGQDGCDLFLGRTFAADQDLREPWYDGNGNTGQSVFDSAPGTVATPYGTWNHEARVGQGAIVASVVPLLHFGRHYQLNAAANMNGEDIGLFMPDGTAGGWNHGGALAGTNAINRQRSDGVNFVVIFNKRNPDDDGPAFSSDIRNTIDDLLDDGSITWPAMLVDVTNDCNGNGIADGCEIVDGLVQDSDGDLIPDECQSVLNLTRGEGYPTIATAIGDSQPGDVLQVPPGVHYETLVIGQHPLTLRALTNAGETFVDAAGAGRPLTINAGVTGTVIEGLTFTGGVADSGGGIKITDSIVTVRDCMIENNQSTATFGVLAGGGGVLLDDSDSNFHNCGFVGNTAADDGGGMYAYSCAPEITFSVFRENSAAGGGGLRVSGSGDRPVSVVDSFFLENEAHTYEGGAAFIYQTEVGFDNTVFSGNTTVGHGGAVMFDGPAAVTQLTGCSFTFNSCGEDGGGVWYNGTGIEDLVIDDCWFLSNENGVDSTVSRNGGALLRVGGGATTITNSRFEENQSNGFGGAMRVQGVGIEVSDCTFDLNEGTDGGAIWFGAEATVLDCAFTDNTGLNDGGAIRSGVLTMARCSFDGNVGTRFGGAVTVTDGLIEASSFTGNDAGDRGGAIFHWGVTLDVVNCLLAGNTANRGGGFAGSGNSRAVLTNDTIVANVATDQGGGLYLPGPNSSDVLLHNTIVWSNAAPTGAGLHDIEHITAAHSNVQDQVLPGPANRSEDPFFADAAEDDYRLSSCSGLLDAGDNGLIPAGITTDLDGNDRTQDANNDGASVVDLGAYEADDSMCPWDVDDGGAVDVIDLLAMLGSWGQPDPALDFDCSGLVDVTDLLGMLGAWGTCP